MTRKGRGRTGKKVNRPSRAARGRGSFSDNWKRWTVSGICVGLIVITWVVFGRTAGFDFLNYDDSFYVYENPLINRGLTRAGLIAAFTQPLVGNWHPLTSISLMLDAQFFGLKAGGYHGVNVLLHSIAVLLLFIVLRTLTDSTWRSAFVAAVFAIHPLRAESVVWISERKDVLSGVFFMLMLGSYVRYARHPQFFSYLLVAVTLMLGLLAKAMLVTAPVILLLLDYWPLRRFASLDGEQIGERTIAARSQFTWLIVEKLPLFAISAAVSIATIFTQQLALEAASYLTLPWRIENALVSVWVYLRQAFWPFSLAIFYPHPKGSLPFWEVGLALVMLVITSAAIFLQRKRYLYLITGWLWYLVMILPVIGLVQVGWQAHADRYTYLPQIGISIIVAWGVADLGRGWHFRRFVTGFAGALTVIVLMFIAWKQVDHWSTSVRLWTHTLAVTKNNDVAERGLGTALLKLGRIQEAIVHDRAALKIRPGDANALTNLANALFQAKEFPEAVAQYRELVRLRPNDGAAHRNLGKALSQSGATDEAIVEFKEALRIRSNDPDASYSLGNAFLQKNELVQSIEYFRKTIQAQPAHAAAHYNLGIALQRSGQLDQAIEEFRQTINLQPQHFDAHNNLAIALSKTGQLQEAIAAEQSALRIKPENAEFHSNLASIFLQTGQVADAVAQWREAVRLQPDKLGPQISLAWVLATTSDSKVRNGAEALDLAQRAHRAAGDRNLMASRVLAAAFAEQGQFAQAIETARDGMRRADAAGQFSLVGSLQEDLVLYQQGIPLRESAASK
jgi:tetratricopeptide (TPR) repeat protein